MKWKTDFKWLDEELLKNSNKQKRITWLKVPDDKEVVVRFFPFNKETIIKEKQHWGLLERPINCLTMFGKKCPICDALWKVRKEEGVDIRKYLPSDAYVTYVFKVDNTANGFDVVDKTPYLFRIYNSFMEEIKLQAKYGNDITDPVNGVCVIMKRDNNKIVKTITGIKLSIEDKLKEIEEDFKPITELFKEPSEEVIEKAISAINAKFNKKVFVNNVVEDTTSKKVVNNEIVDKVRELFGIELEDEYVNCFGKFGSQGDKCDNCVYYIPCEEFNNLK